MPTDEAADLAAYLASEFPAIDDPIPEPEMIDEGRAARMLRRLAIEEAEEARIRRAADEERARIADWESDRLRGVLAAQGWLDRALEGFARMMHARTGKLRVSLPTGHLQLREAAVSVEVVDADAFRAWCDGEGQTALLGPPSPPAPDKAAIKRALDGPLALGTVAVPDTADEKGRARYAIVTEGGEFVPGVVAIRHPTGRTFTANPNQGDTQ